MTPGFIANGPSDFGLRSLDHLFRRLSPETLSLLAGIALRRGRLKLLGWGSARMALLVPGGRSVIKVGLGRDHSYERRQNKTEYDNYKHKRLPVAPVRQLSPDVSIMRAVDTEHGINSWEGFPEWARGVDGNQVGYTQYGKRLVCYDAGVE